MADMSIHLMLDDINLSIEAPRSAPAYAIAGYVNGRYANWAAVVAHYGPSGKFLLSIDVKGSPSAGAQCLDVERGDATNAQAPGWFKATRAAGVIAKDLRQHPKLYTSRNNVPALVNAMHASGVQRNEYLVWSAHYGAGAHICGPRTCGLGIQCDATQYTSSYGGVSLDASLCFGYFFTGPLAPPKPPPKPPKPPIPPVRPAAPPVALPVPPKPPAPPEPVKPPTPVSGTPRPIAAPAGKATVVAYVPRSLSGTDTQKLGVPAGSVLYVPYHVEAA